MPGSILSSLNRRHSSFSLTHRKSSPLWAVLAPLLQPSPLHRPPLSGVSHVLPGTSRELSLRSVGDVWGGGYEVMMEEVSL